MKLNEVKFGLSAAYAVAIIWVLCSLLVGVLPGVSMHMSGYMSHADYSGMMWQMGFTGFFYGLILWSVIAGLFFWLLALIYNKLT